MHPLDALGAAAEAVLTVDTSMVAASATQTATRRSEIDDIIVFPPYTWPTRTPCLSLGVVGPVSVPCSPREGVAYRVSLRFEVFDPVPQVAARAHRSTRRLGAGESIWPDTRQWVADAFRGVPENGARMILGENAIRVSSVDRADDVLEPDFARLASA